MRLLELKKPEALQLQKRDLIQKLQSMSDKDPDTAKLLDRITQLLTDVGVGGRVASLLSRVEAIEDKDVQRAVRKIAKIISTVDFDQAGRETLFKMWNGNQIVDTKRLLSGGTHTFDQIFRGYGQDPAMTELVDDFNDVIAQGIGPGEFALACLSKGITGVGAGKEKGDLIIDKKPVELKTKNVKDARMYDRQVTVTPKYDGLVQKFMQKYSKDIQQLAAQGLKLSKQGLNLGQLMALMQSTKNKQGIIKDVTTMLNNVFPGQKIDSVVSALAAGDVNKAKQLYGQININYYLNYKRSQGDLDGILFANLGQKTYTYIRSTKDFKGSGMDINVSGTPYPIATADPKMNPYPQIGVKAI